MNDAITCTGPECDRAISRKGLCVTHYNQHLAGKQLAVIAHRKDRRPATPCCAAGCNRAVTNVQLAMCATHAAQIKRGAEITPIADRVGRYSPGELCSFEDCTHPAHARSFCKRHYDQSKWGKVRELGPEKVKAMATASRRTLTSGRPA